ncbi:TIGR03118 family protein [Paraflavisolibacter sp. H34]|uniref:TIGR03118 family protein n=1 Tax=Huijunlia imazamoxiresistens TaxID=3127457 RepID=UPI003016CEC5
MKKSSPNNGGLPAARAGFPLTFLLFLLCCFTGCRKHFDLKSLKEFKQVNLVTSDAEYPATYTDTALKNAWGIAFNPSGVAWVTSTGGHVSTVYNAEGMTLRPPVAIPSPAGATGGMPTGIVLNNAGPNDFMLSNGARAAFIFAGADGILSGWNGAAGNMALAIKNNSATAAYTGLAIGQWAGRHYLYAANFRAGKINVWDAKFDSVSMYFYDHGLPEGYAPFNIQNIGGKLFVTYAKVGEDGRAVKEEGKGYVAVYTTSGQFVGPFAARGHLNAPWGLAKASASFFADTGDNGLFVEEKDGGHHRYRQPAILVGNFGDGRINAYSLVGDYLGQLKTKEKVIEIEGLWALMFPPASAISIDRNRLYFAAGPDDETEGLFGYIAKD